MRRKLTAALQRQAGLRGYVGHCSGNARQRRQIKRVWRHNGFSLRALTLNPAGGIYFVDKKEDNA